MLGFISKNLWKCAYKVLSSITHFVSLQRGKKKSSLLKRLAALGSPSTSPANQIIKESGVPFLWPERATCTLAESKRSNRPPTLTEASIQYLTSFDPDNHPSRHRGCHLIPMYRWENRVGGFEWVSKLPKVTQQINGRVSSGLRSTSCF